MAVKNHDISFQKYLFHLGKNYQSYKFLGVHPASHDPRDGYWVRVWAPRAVSVSLIADFNGWNVDATPLERMKDDSSIWQTRCIQLQKGDLYKFAIRTDKGKVLFKADPYAFESEAGSVTEGYQNASRVSDLAANYRWGDRDWIRKRDHENHYRSPINIYEVHLGSWDKKEDGSYYTYREMADRLIPYVKDMGYTHIELLPIMEHPYDGSWGYQVTGYYSVTSRYGTPRDFKYFVNKAHKNGIGVILDWVPAHFPKDAHGLIEFDGYPLYEDSMPTRMEHKGWGTRAFDYGRNEVLSFLCSNAFFYCDEYHIDGLRVDAIAAMLYLDYDRKDGEWMPNVNGGKENLEAIKFLQTMNEDVLGNYPGVMTIAEESTAWPLVTKPPSIGGLGFNFKWNMGWMNDVLDYFGKDPLFRGGAHNQLTFSLTYAYSENYILPVSHDEVVHGKKSMIDKMPGEYDEKFDGLRSFFIYMMTHPGKKLTFMGTEFAQFTEWNEKKPLDWMLLDYDKHRQMKKFVQDLNQLYKMSSALWIADDRQEGFTWIDADNAKDTVYTYYRTDPDGKDEETLVIALNLSGREFPEYDIGVPEGKKYGVLIDSDAARYGGSGLRKEYEYKVQKVQKGTVNGRKQIITIPLPPRSGIILERRKEG
ncbi:MAG: 1,4-alpha-glucan branching protein GlgB [Anaerovoracaceae bacterium]|jgi:1,4-alpha-glucan branching enzyme